MSEDFHKPTLFWGSKFEEFQGGDDPAQISRIAHETANALLVRVRQDPQPEVLDRLVRYTDVHGIDAVAELWAMAAARSLPGALWRIYLLRILVRQDAAGVSLLYQRGTETVSSIDALVAGAPVPAGPGEIAALADVILRGLFDGDFGIALDRAAAFCRVVAAGATSVADDLEPAEPERATEFTTRALRFSELAVELGSCARLWRSGSLD